MAVKTETKTIGEHEYSVTQWNVELAMLNKFKLLKAFGASIAKLALLDDKKDNEVEVLGNGLTELFNTNDPKELMQLMKQCVVGVAKDGKKITESSFIQEFTANDIMNVYKVFVFVLQVNYGNFLQGQWANDLLTKVGEV